MRSIGMPELLVILGLFVILLPGVAIVAVAWFVNRGRQQHGVASRTCGSCGQRVPDIGSYCSFCGQKYP
jgi:uncharacterized membrane protein YvlD (DUF360 family)